jgi:5-hydroxyisourate hydrolase-like protein (transthyretin family)
MVGIGLALAAAPSFAQTPPPDHNAATSAPLFVEDLPVGTVSVRITHPSMTEPVAGVNVVGAWTTKDGKQKSATLKTGEDGRAIFKDIPTGSTFAAKTTVEGENLATAQFSVPDQGGTRLLVIVGAQAAEAMNEMTGGAASAAGMPAQPKAVGVRSGKVEAREGMKVGTLAITVLTAEGKPIPGIAVDLGRVQKAGGGVDFVHAVSDEAGIAHFAGLNAGEGAYAAVVERDGMRVGTPAFMLEDKHGAAGEIRLPGRTSELSALHISASSRMMVELREDAIGVLQNLHVENTSDKVFDPGPRGLFIPLPEGFAGAEKLPGGVDLEIKEGVGAFLHALLPPAQSPGAAAQVRLGYVLTTHETPDYEIIQPMPLGLQGGLVMIPGDFAIGLSSPGLRARPPERDDNGNELRMFEMDSVAPGQALHLTVLGLPTRQATGKWIAAVLAGLLVAGGVVASRRPRQARARNVGNAGKAG